MHTRFVIFVAISAFLVGAIYSSSPHVVFGELKTSCTGTSKTTTHCTVFDTVTGDNPSFNCTYHKTSKSCADNPDAHALQRRRAGRAPAFDAHAGDTARRR